MNGTQQPQVDPFSFTPRSNSRYQDQSNDELTQEQIDRINAQIDALNSIGEATDNESFHQQLYGRYLDLIGGMYPGREESMNEAAALSESMNPDIARRGTDVLSGLVGAQEDTSPVQRDLYNQYLQSQFESQFGVMDESPDVASQNLALREYASQNPNLVQQYLSEDTNPNFIESVSDWFGSWKGGEENTLDALQQKRRLKKSGFNSGYLQ